LLLRPRGENPQPRGWATHCTQGSAGKPLTALVLPTEHVRLASASQQRRRIASASAIEVPASARDVFVSRWSRPRRFLKIFLMVLRIRPAPASAMYAPASARDCGVYCWVPTLSRLSPTSMLGRVGNPVRTLHGCGA